MKSSYSTKGIIICGGVPAWINIMQKAFYGIRIYEGTPNQEALKTASTIWIQSNAIKHKHYYRIISIARKHHIPVCYFESKSASRCSLQLQTYLQSLN